MARMRTIKPGFFTDEELVELPFEVRLLFVGLWTLADREGRLTDKPKQIKMAIFPADNVDVDKGLSELHQRGLVQRYVVDNKRYIQIVTFLDHQYPHKNEKDSDIPAPKCSDANPSVLDITEKQIPVEQITDTPEPDAVRVVFSYWQKVLNHPKAKLTPDRVRKIKNRLDEKYSIDDLKAAVDGCRASPYHMGKNDEKKIHDGIDLIFRNGSYVEKFMGYRNGTSNGNTENPNSADFVHNIADGVTVM